MNVLRGQRLRVLSIVLLLWGAVIIGRLVTLQLVQGPKYRARAQRQQERRVELSGRRGPILDRQGRELAVSVEVSSVYAIGEEIEDPEGAAASLAPLVRSPREKIRERLSEAKGFVWIARKVDPAVADQIRLLKLAGFISWPSPALLSEGKPRGRGPRLRGPDDRGLGPRVHLRERGPRQPGGDGRADGRATVDLR
jgi:cell division protein FtsI/penicillin-binding protein 2